MTTTPPHGHLLRRSLTANAVFSALSGIVAIAAAAPLADAMDIAWPWLVVIGAGLLPFAVIVAVTGRSRPIDRARAWSVVGADLAWVVGAIAVTAVPNLLTAEGKWLLAGVSSVVAGLTAAQWLGLRRLG